jgi:hypothetical protein
MGTQAKVLKSIEDKARKAAVKNNTTALESKKRRGSDVAKAVSKKRKIGATSVVASTRTREDAMKSVHGGSTSTAVSMQGEHFAAFADLKGDDFVQTALAGMVGGATAEASIVAPIPGVLGDELSSSEGEDGGGGNAYAPNDAEVESLGRCP